MCFIICCKKCGWPIWYWNSYVGSCKTGKLLRYHTKCWQKHRNVS